MRAVLASFLVLSSAAVCRAAEPTAPAGATEAQLRQSWIAIGEVAGGRALTPGEQVEVPIDYNLAPGQPAVLTLSGLGPWIDCPDGTYTTKRFHVDYGLRQTVPVQPGAGRHVFTFTVPVRSEPRASILWLAAFQDAKGKQWPWHERSGSAVAPAAGFFTVASAQPGNLFTYDQPLVLNLRLGAKAVAGARSATWTVIGRDGATVASGSQAFTASGPDQVVPLNLGAAAGERRGVLGLRVAVDGWGQVETTYARVPTPGPDGAGVSFGMHGTVRAGDPESAMRAMRVARRMGLTSCRVFLSWRNLQPSPDQWHLEGWDKAFALAQAEGISPSVCLGNPPTWVMREGYLPRYQPFDFDRDAWKNTITTLATRWKGKIGSWEWLNEIVPGDCQQPVADYVDFVRIGTEAVRAADPKAVIQLAGGLWPRNYRLALLTAGIGTWIDALPVHYSNGAGVAEAADDLLNAGARNVAVWDNETGRGVSTWGMPLEKMLGLGLQSDWVMERWPDELEAGAKRLVFFGGWGDPAGNWDYSYEDGTPRPVAATLAVLTSKLRGTVPQGSFSLPGADGRAGAGPFHLFARDGKAVLVAPKKSTDAGRAELRTGGGTLTISDDQGEERALATADGVAALDLAARPTFVEGGDLATLRAYTTAELRTAQLSLLAGRTARIDVQLRNRGEQPLSGSLELTPPAGWPAVAPQAFTLAPGEQRLATIDLAAPASAAGGTATASLACRFADARLPVVAQPVAVHVLVAAELGNLLANAGFDQGAKNWTISGGNIATTSDPLPGVDPHVLRFADAKAWVRAAQGIPLAGGRQYLYTAWARNTGMNAGSNIDQQFADGTSKSLYTPRVFVIGNAPEWTLVSAVYDAPPTLAKATFAPVANGTGNAEYDNLRVTLYDGTVHVAEAVRATKPPVIDGALDDWAPGCPIPLLGPGQTTVLDQGYAWTPANLRGVARLAWDEKNLYLAAEVVDDQQVALTGEQTSDGDSLVLALHPANRAPGQDAQAYEYLISAGNPNGGGGRYTLYRPAAHAGGRSSGQLARDSSLYELTVTRSGTRTIYEARLPWSELGIDGRFGAKLGLSLQLNDNDGKGRAAFISWGGGLHPAWAPTQMGTVTLVE